MKTSDTKNLKTSSIKTMPRRKSRISEARRKAILAEAQRDYQRLRENPAELEAVKAEGHFWDRAFAEVDTPE